MKITLVLIIEEVDYEPVISEIVEIGRVAIEMVGSPEDIDRVKHELSKLGRWE